MSDKKVIVIQDTCIIFDLVDYDLIEGFFQLGLEVWTTFQVMAEIRREEQFRKVEPFVHQGYICIDIEATFEEIFKMGNNYPGLSVADHSVIELAIRKTATILSADGGLRRVAVARGIPLHGLVWVMGELCYRGIIPPSEVIIKLERYAFENGRSPKPEIEALIIKIKEEYSIQ